MRADTRKNYDHLLAVAREVIEEDGVDASLRNIARRAGVGLATLFRRFPTREALLEVLLRAAHDKLMQRADELEKSKSPDEALVLWLNDAAAYFRTYHGIVTFMAAALADPSTALHASCTGIRSTGTRLLQQAQAAGLARTDVDGTDLFALIGGLGWVGDQPAFAPRADHLAKIVAATILAKASPLVP